MERSVLPGVFVAIGIGVTVPSSSLGTYAVGVMGAAAPAGGAAEMVVTPRPASAESITAAMPTASCNVRWPTAISLVLLKRC
jgi:hypothetical protein